MGIRGARRAGGASVNRRIVVAAGRSSGAVAGLALLRLPRQPIARLVEAVTDRSVLETEFNQLLAEDEGVERVEPAEERLASHRPALAVLADEGPGGVRRGEALRVVPHLVLDLRDALPAAPIVHHAEARALTRGRLAD